MGAMQRQREFHSGFISKALDKWANDNKVTLDVSRPGKPTDNPNIERSQEGSQSLRSFNGSFRMSARM